MLPIDKNFYHKTTDSPTPGWEMLLYVKFNFVIKMQQISLDIFL